MLRGAVTVIALLMSVFSFSQSGLERETVPPFKIDHQGKTFVAFSERQVELMVDFKDDYETAMLSLLGHQNSLAQARVTIEGLKNENIELRRSNESLTGIIELDSKLLEKKDEVINEVKDTLQRVKLTKDVALIVAVAGVLTTTVLIVAK